MPSVGWGRQLVGELARRRKTVGLWLQLDERRGSRHMAPTRRCITIGDAMTNLFLAEHPIDKQR